MNIEPESKHLKSGVPDSSNCALCLKKLEHKGRQGHFVRNPIAEGLQTLFAALEIRKDEAFHRLVPFKDDIFAGRMNIAFHKSCRATYTSKSNLLQYMGPGGEDNRDETSTKTVSLGASQAGTPRLCRDDLFNIRRDCFICSKSHKRGEKLTQIATGKGEDTRLKVLAAASSRDDNVVNMRMTAHPDLFAYDAKYHRSCYAAYISERNVTAAKRKSKDSTDPSNDPEFLEITKEIQENVLSGSKYVTTLAQVKSDYIEKLSQMGIQKEVYSWKLKDKLKNHFGDRLAFIEQRGQSDLVCSSTITVGDALKKAAELQVFLQ